MIKRINILFFSVIFFSGTIFAENKVSIDLKMNLQRTDTTYVISSLLIKKSDNSPVKDISVLFEVKRLFGWMKIKEETTDSLGIANVILPINFLPESNTNKITIRGSVSDDDVVADVSKEFIFETKSNVQPSEEQIRREIWSSHAPVWLIITISILVGGVWLTYLYVLKLILSIKNSNPKI